MFFERIKKAIRGEDDPIKIFVLWIFLPAIVSILVVANWKIIAEISSSKALHCLSFFIAGILIPAWVVAANFLFYRNRKNTKHAYVLLAAQVTDGFTLFFLAVIAVCAIRAII